jgi:ribonuclease P protein component
MGITGSNLRLFHFGAAIHETHIPTLGRQAQAHPRLSRPDEKRRRAQGAFGAPGEGPRAAYALIATRLVAMGGAVRRCPLTGAGAFDSIFRHGLRRDGEYVQLISVKAARACGRTGFVIGRKALPLAVDRNRIRRMLRVAVRRAGPAIAGHDVILRLKRGAPRTEFPRIVAEAEQLLAAFGSGRRTQ